MDDLWPESRYRSSNRPAPRTVAGLKPRPDGAGVPPCVRPCERDDCRITGCERFSSSRCWSFSAGASPHRAQADLGVPSKDGLVVCVSTLASDVGASILARGGNAVDAAVATAFALAVTHPAAGNIGGGGFMIVRKASGDVTTFDYRERAPLKSTPTMYLGSDGKIDRSLTAAGYLAPGVPGTVRGLEMAHKKFGKLRWKDVVAPAVQLAEGFTMSAGLARGLNREVRGPMAKFPASVAAYGKPGGGDWVEGDRLVQADLARTLRAIAEDGPDAFYKGWIADRIAEDMTANGGIISKEDLAAYRAKERAPVRGTYKGFEIISMPPPSSGGVALVEMLNILEPYDLKARGLLTPPALHIQIEAMRRAYLDRARFLGDPDFSDVPVAKLTSKQHAKEIAGSIGLDKASSSVELGKDIVTAAATAEPDETTHFSVIDRDGLAVTNTYTLEGELRLARRRQGRGLSPQQRDGRLQQEARRDQPHRRHRHASQRHRAAQARCSAR